MLYPTHLKRWHAPFRRNVPSLLNLHQNRVPSTSVRRRLMSMSSSEALPPSKIPIFTTVTEYRIWRRNALKEGKTVGFVPTMGALHAGHLSLVERSLSENDLTVVSIFVNPTQFAPHEDLTSYPRTLPDDLESLSHLAHPPLSASETATRTPSAVFLPSVREMYPSGVSQDVANQKGTFVEVKGYGEQMEGKSRPTFFRGVTTVVTKLFNAIEPTNAYFGQKDIQQALLLRRMTRDLLLSHPDPDHLHIVPTARDAQDGLALSSRNVYLSLSERQFAPAIYASLKLAEKTWAFGATKGECVRRAVRLIEERAENAEGVEVKVDYVDMNYAESFDVVADDVARGDVGKGGAVILSGAVWVGKTRLIDNIVLDDLNANLSGVLH